MIGRSRRLRGIVYQSDIDSWTRANARRSAEAHKRAEVRGELQAKVIAEMIKSLSSGVPKERAMEKAFKAGAYWRQIGEHFGKPTRCHRPRGRPIQYSPACARRATPPTRG